MVIIVFRFSSSFVVIINSFRASKCTNFVVFILFNVFFRLFYMYDGLLKVDSGFCVSEVAVVR